MPRESIMSVETFRNRTRKHSVLPVLKDGRSSLLKNIDHWLDVWQTCGTYAPEDKKIGILYLLAKACNKWLKTKGRKHATKPSKTYSARKCEIEGLMKTAIEWIDGYQRHLGTAYDRYNRHKTHGQTMQNLKSLSPYYRLEREHYSEVKQNTDRLNRIANPFRIKPAAPIVGHRPGTNPYSASHYDDQFGDNKDGATLGQFKTAAESAKRMEVLYLNPLKRIPYLITANPNIGPRHGLFENIHDELVHMTKIKIFRTYLEEAVYAMDKYGNLFTLIDASTGLDAKADLGYFINHSSVLAGKEVACAGCLLIRNGRMVSIDNNSGHYKPTVEQLRACVEFLRDSERADLSQCRVGVIVGGEPVYYNADTFIDHPGHAPDWDVSREGAW